MITIKDVASLANVSTATASRALRNLGYISKETYERVTNAATQLGYIANATAQQLKTNTFRTVGFIISDIKNEYYFGILSHLHELLSSNGMELIIAFSSENPSDEEKSFRSLIANRVSAILFIPTSDRNQPIIDIAKQNGIKVIQLFRDIYQGLDTIINDDEQGCFAATEHLLKKGCKRLLLVDVSYKYLDFNAVKPNRSTGFMQALKGTTVASKVINFPLMDYNVDILYRAIDEFRPDGIITATNQFGFEVLSHLKCGNLEKEVDLISFDDNQWLEFCSVSAVRQNSDSLTDSICKCISDKTDKVYKEKIVPSLAIRD